ncbi:MAG: hypothetical protein KUL82_12600 [Bdellovibrio sp.]|nr:hypothetical protein [Bdellovibrio sp.]
MKERTGASAEDLPLYTVVMEAFVHIRKKEFYFTCLFFTTFLLRDAYRRVVAESNMPKGGDIKNDN